jgi:hypothetical protein
MPSLRFYAELNDRLPSDQLFRTLETERSAGTVGDLIESFGVPLDQVELVVVNGESAPFSHAVGAGDRIAVYPVFETFDVATELKVRSGTLRQTKFVVDAGLKKLAVYLRMLGFDTICRAEACDGHRRILLTQDPEVLRDPAVTHGYLVRQKGSHRQVREVVTHLDLGRSIRLFARCRGCNSVLVSDLEPLPACASCGRTQRNCLRVRNEADWQR